MKKSLLALAALTAFAGAASAQSTVTLFGGFDMGVAQVKNNATRTLLRNDGIYSSRLGFRTMEDLGGGLRAGVWIEGSMTGDNGTAGNQSWQRRSTASLMGSFGEIRLGRDYVPDFWNHTVFDPFGTNGGGSSLNIFGRSGVAGTGQLNGASTAVRANNTVGYFLPAMGGLYGQLMVAAGEGTPGNKMYGGRLGWAAGPFNVAGAWSQTEITFNQDLTNWNIGGSWNLGFMTLTGFYSTIEADNSSNFQQTNWYVGGIFPMGAFTFKATYGGVDRDSNIGGCYNSSSASSAAVTSCDASQLALGLTYDLSKRTALYATYSMIDNSGTVFRTFGGTNALPGRNDDNQAYQFGVRHSF